MRILIVGVGALGGTIATRAIRAGMPVCLATRTSESAAALRAVGLRVSGIGGPATAAAEQVAAIDEYARADPFDLVVLATKAHDALAVAPFAAGLLAPGGSLLPIQNGGVSGILADRLGRAVVLGGLSNLGATMVRPGAYEQRNAGHLLIGELAGGTSARAAGIAGALGRAVETRVTPNMEGAVWAKLLLNCSVTTIGAVAGQTMRQYLRAPAGRDLFTRVYAETLAVALAGGVRPEKMIVEPQPPGWPDPDWQDGGAETWIGQILAAYGDLKPSMLQDFERRRRTEVDFINGYVAERGSQLGQPTELNAAIVRLVHRIEERQIRPDPARIDELVQADRTAGRR